VRVSIDPREFNTNSSEEVYGVYRSGTCTIFQYTYLSIPTMKVLIIAVGSRGNVEPFCALTAKLLESGHTVEFFCQPKLFKIFDSSFR
jgi:Glycosyltransferase family 28 N-terminal domain